jgi:hypothetical protein
MKNDSVAKGLLAVFLLLLFCAGGVSAYAFSFITPDEQTATVRQGVGIPLVVECYSDSIPPGATMTITMTGPSGNRVFSESMVIQSDRYFGTTFDTSNLPGGAYTVTVQAPKAYELGSKRNWFTVQLIDRTGELTNAAQRVQTDPSTLRIAGKAAETGARGVEITAYKGSAADGTVIYGPEWVGTDDSGQFSLQVPAQGTGMYQVVVADTAGYIGTLTYTIAGNAATPTPVPTEAVTVSASAIASLAEPAYFAVKTAASGATEISVIRGADWVIEYSLNGAAPVRSDTVDAAGDEKFTVTGNGAVLYLMAYPKEGSAKAYVYCKNAVSIAEDPAAGAYFGDPVADPSATSASLGFFIPVLGISGAAVLLRRR